MRRERGLGLRMERTGSGDGERTGSEDEERTGREDGERTGERMERAGSEEADDRE